MFVRKKRNKSGTVSVQIIDKRGGKYKVVHTIGSSHDENEIEDLYRKALHEIPKLQHQNTFAFLSSNDETILDFLQNLSNSNIRAIGAELVFGRLFDHIGFNQIEDNEIFRHLVLARLVYQGSKLKLTQYLRRYEHKTISVHRIYRFMDRLNSRYKETVETIAFEHTKKVLGEIAVVFYDMTTLYFESEDEDDFRRIGFSKDGKFQNPQIMLGLLVGKQGYPIGYELFEGNTFEGHTLIPVLKKFQHKFNLQKPIVIADSGLLSRSNIQALTAKGYGYIIGARIKKENEVVQKKILALDLASDGTFGELKKEDERLIVAYSEKRARKDAHNRQKGLKRLEKKLRSGKLTKAHINARGYNKYLRLDNEVRISIDYDRYETDRQWDGLKGYITNTTLPAEQVIESYANLWQIEKAFRMSKTDLRIRPIYHFSKRRIEAHICISFVAYGIYKELERLLARHHAPFSANTARDIIHNIYQLTVTLPDSKVEESILLGLDEEQQLLLDIIHQET